MKYFRILFIFSVVLCLTAMSTSYAQSTKQGDIILSWRAINFFPADFTGKAAASPFSPVEASVSFVENGKIQDISKSLISWKLDNKYLASGTGMQNATFNVQKSKGDFHILSVSISQNSSELKESIIIPVGQQTIIIELPFPGNTIPSGNESTITAIPYFFNISSLKDISFFWQINNDKKSGSNTISLNSSASNISNQKIIEVTASAQKNNNPMEFAKTKSWLKLK